jgi:hypothetical protein
MLQEFVCSLKCGHLRQMADLQEQRALAVLLYFVRHGKRNFT